MDDEREEGEIVDVNEDDFYENIISSDDEVVIEEDEYDLRQRIQELEAKNSELEKIASISKTYDYGLGCGPSIFIDLVDDDDGGDDDESFFRQPSKYECSYSSSRRRSHSKRRKPSRHECKKFKRHKQYKSDRRKKPSQPNRSRVGSDSSSDDEFQYTANERNKLQAALTRNTSSVNSTTLKRKLIGVSKTVEDFIKAKEDVGDEDISTSIEIMHLINKINIEEIATKHKAATVLKEDTESGLNEQELRLIALKSAILKKAEARKKRKIIETQPYSPTDDVTIENVLAAKALVNSKPRDELDNMEISPVVSPTHQDGCLQLIDMDLESEDESEEVINTQQEVLPSSDVSKSAESANVTAKNFQKSIIVPVPDEISLNKAKVPEDTDRFKLSFDDVEHVEPRKQQQEDDDDEEALRASLLANLKIAKKNTTTNNSTRKTSMGEDAVLSEKASSDTSVETERLRKQAISSIGKRKHVSPNPFAQKYLVQVPKLMEVSVPKPMEMSMSQITSNLKTALMRIRLLGEKDKQNIEVDAKATQHLNVISENAKQIPVDVPKRKTTQAEIMELKNIAHKLNGGISLKGTSSELTVILKKTCEPNAKVNNVLKNVTGNNTSVETKAKDSEAVPLVISNKNETASLEKSEPTVILKKTCEPNAKVNNVLKNVAGNNTSVETKAKDSEAVPLVISNKSETASLEQSEPTVILKKTCEPNAKVNNVLKNVAGNNTSVETKAKDSEAVPLVISNKSETASLEQSEPTVILKKTCEPNAKVNDVLKNVTGNNTSVETKAKDSAAVPLVVSNKIETTSLEKSDTTIRSLKAVAQKKVITEPQKENQQLQKVVGVSLKRTSEEKPAAAKKHKQNNAKVSRVITTPVEKPIKKLIIQLNNSDTDSDDFGLGQESMEKSLNSKSYSGVASPASYTYSPASPANLADNKSSDTIPPNNDIFQRKLDEYLKRERTKVEKTNQETNPIKKSPSLVSHLPPSSQLEYRKLINRMALLEKQKQLKLTKSKIAPSKPNLSNISVTIANDLCNLKSDEQIVRLNGNDIRAQKEKQTEVLVTFRSVDTPTSVESSNVTRMSVAAVADASGTKGNELNAPKLAAKRSVIDPETKDPDKSTILMPNISTLSAHEKQELLRKSEAEYMSYSDLYLVDLNNMSQLVNTARQEKEKQFLIESEIEEMEARVQALKKQLVKQKLSVSKLYPTIASSHKNIMKKRSKSLLLNKKCYYVGNKIAGADYKIPGDPKADIADKVKSLSSETKLLRNMQKPVVTGSTAPISIDETGVQEELMCEDTPVAAAAAVISCEKPNEVAPSVNGTPPDNIPTTNSITTYKSPLDHMGNIGVTNPDSIVCPFQLLGQCEDRECTYQHLS